MSWTDEITSWAEGLNFPGKKTESIRTQVAVIGAGVSGMVCARDIAKTGLDVLVLEASDGVGGRIRTDSYDGFLLDRGFQVFIEPYPEAQRQLDYKALGLKQFLPGALVRFQGDLHLVADPFRRPMDLLAGLVAPIGSLTDKVKVGLYRVLAVTWTNDEIFKRKETTTYDWLSREVLGGLSDDMIDRFFRPFYQGIYLAPLEDQSSRMFEFVFQMFAKGAASLPAQGMGAVSDQLAASLLDNPTAQLETGACVTGLEKGGSSGHILTLKDGRRVTCDDIVVATDGPTASRLLGASVVPCPESRQSTCVYFAIDGPPPVDTPILVLNGEMGKEDNDDDGAGSSSSSQKKLKRAPVVNNVCFPSVVQAAYAPQGSSLASVTIVGLADGYDDAALAKECQAQLSDWFGDSVDSWRFLRSYRIFHAQPAQTPSVPQEPFEKDPVEVSPGVFVCGDHFGTATLNGALESAKRASTAVLCQAKYAKE